MNFFRNLFGKKQPAQGTAATPAQPYRKPPQPATGELRYYQYSMAAIPDPVGFCSDRECPCSDTEIPKGAGYLYISQAAVDHMRDKMDGTLDGFGLVMGPMPVLVCEQGAQLRGLDLHVAGDDAKMWWKTGRVPLRPTPLAR